MPTKNSIADVLPGLEHPLWEGTDDEFAVYVHETFGIPESITTVTITPRASSGRCAVAIGWQAGAIVFVMSTNATARQTHIAPVVMGPLFSDRDVVDRAKASSGDANMRAVTALALRHLPHDVVLSLLAPRPVH
jgi:hypothetical protein